jgi:single-stranded-DNA-specific exonuclease
MRPSRIDRLRSCGYGSPMARGFLGVEQSATGRAWRDRLDDSGRALALRMVQEQGIPDVVARVLAGRGVDSADISGFLEPKLRDLMPDPMVLQGMEGAVERLVHAIKSGETIGIFGDYDVDGACASALLAGFLDHAGTPRLVHIPDRLIEGYGPNQEAIGQLASAGATLIVNVDCGTTSHEVIASARGRGLDVLVLDHHQAPEILPDATAIVNPNRQDDVSGLGTLCAAGVVFLTLVALNRALRASDHWTTVRPEPDLLSMLDLVALATIADVVPLIGLNRAFVRQGLMVMRRRERPGLRALADVARLDGPIEPYHLGFLLGPRINAGGRIGDAALGAQLLLTKDEDEAVRIAQQLDALNRDRQTIEAAMVAEAEAEALAMVGLDEESGSVLVLASPQWHPGVAGLVASRLKERFQRPAFAVALDPSGMGTGSGRSVPGVDLGRAVRAAVEEGIARKGGGHAMAAGVTIAAARLTEFRAFLEDRLGAAVSLARADRSLAIDAAVTASGVRASLVNEIEKAGPFGSSHPEPLFVLPSHRLIDVGEVGNGHMRVRLRAGDGSTIKGIAFRAAERPLGQALLQHRNESVHVAGQLAIDRYGGSEAAQIRIVDLASAKPV